jgi:hypothetical protein
MIIDDTNYSIRTRISHLFVCHCLAFGSGGGGGSGGARGNFQYPDVLVAEESKV